MKVRICPRVLPRGAKTCAQPSPVDLHPPAPIDFESSVTGNLAKIDVDLEIEIQS